MLCHAYENQGTLLFPLHINTKYMEVWSYDTPDAWSVSLEEFDHGLFTTVPWNEAFRTGGRKPVYLDFVADGCVVAKMAGFVLPHRLAVKRKLIFHAGPAPLPGGAAVIPQCLTALARFARVRRIGRIHIFSYDYRYGYEAHPAFHVYPRMEMSISLEGDMEEITGRMSRRIIRNYKHGVKEDLSFSEECTGDPVATIDRLLQDTLKVRTGKGYHRYDPYYIPYFGRDILSSLIQQQCLRIVTVKRGETIHGNYIMLADGVRAYGLLIGTSEAGYSLRVPTYMHYVILHFLKKEGYRYLNLGGVSPDETHKGLLEFKQSLGAQPVTNSFAETDFLVFPYTLLNIANRLKRALRERSDRRAHGCHDSSEPR